MMNIQDAIMKANGMHHVKKMIGNTKEKKGKQKMVSTTYIIFRLDEEGNGHDDYFQAGNAQQAADWARKCLGAYEVAEIAKVVKNWK